MSEKRFTAIGCHVYAGGFTLGMRESLDVRGHVEKYKLGAETARKNLGLPVVCAPDAFSNYAARAAELAGPVDVVYGNPPCLAFSQLGCHRGVDDPICNDWEDVVTVARAHDPEIVIIECVTGVWKTGRALIEKTVAALPGYKPYVLLTDAVLHGLPQYRARFHLVLSKVVVDFPAPTAQTVGGTVGQAWEAAGLPPEDYTPYFKNYTRMRRISEYCPQNSELRRLFQHLIRDLPKPVRNLPPFSIKRLGVKHRSWTLAGGQRYLHPTHWRYITPIEAAVLQGYPANWTWPIGGEKAAAEIGKCVTPVMGRYLGRVCVAALERGVAVADHEYAITDFRPLVKALCPRQATPMNPATKGILTWEEFMALKREVMNV